MFKYFKKPEVPTSSPDMLTFPFEFSSFQFTMENFVKSFTRNRVTKENLNEILEEVNTALKSDSDSFKVWDHLAIALFIAINGGILACILTLKIKLFVIFAIKLAAIFVGLILNFVVWSCCLGGTSTRIRDKVQGVLDTKDEYFDSKGMRWSVSAENDFPFWIELHIQSQFEMKLEKEKEKMEGKKKPKHAGSYSESKGIMDQGSAQFKKKAKKGKEQKLIYEGMEEEDEYNEEDIEQQPQHQEVEINMQKNKKIDRLYAPLEEDYEENYEDEEANM